MEVTVRMVRMEALDFSCSPLTWVAGLADLVRSS